MTVRSQVERRWNRRRHPSGRNGKRTERTDPNPSHMVKSARSRVSAIGMLRGSWTTVTRRIAVRTMIGGAMTVRSATFFKKRIRATSSPRRSDRPTRSASKPSWLVLITDASAQPAREVANPPILIESCWAFQLETSTKGMPMAMLTMTWRIQPRREVKVHRISSTMSRRRPSRGSRSPSPSPGMMSIGGRSSSTLRGYRVSFVEHGGAARHR